MRRTISRCRSESVRSTISRQRSESVHSTISRQSSVSIRSEDRPSLTRRTSRQFSRADSESSFRMPGLLSRVSVQELPVVEYSSPHRRRPASHQFSRANSESSLRRIPAEFVSHKRDSEVCVCVCVGATRSSGHYKGKHVIIILSPSYHFIHLVTLHVHCDYINC